MSDPGVIVPNLPLRQISIEINHVDERTSKFEILSLHWSI